MRRALTAILCLIVGTAAVAQDALRVEKVIFDGASDRQVVQDVIGGFQTVDYVVSLRAGQTLHVALDTTNLSNCFDITAPGGAKPFFAGGQSGNRHQFSAEADGDYVVRVYLLRLAARDYQSAEYTLTLTLS